MSFHSRPSLFLESFIIVFYWILVFSLCPQTACTFFAKPACCDWEAAANFYKFANLFYNYTGDKATLCANPAVCSGAFAALGNPLGWPWQVWNIPMVTMGSYFLVFSHVLVFTWFSISYDSQLPPYSLFKKFSRGSWITQRNKDKIILNFSLLSRLLCYPEFVQENSVLLRKRTWWKLLLICSLALRWWCLCARKDLRVISSCHRVRSHSKEHSSTAPRRQLITKQDSYLLIQSWAYPIQKSLNLQKNSFWQISFENNCYDEVLYVFSYYRTSTDHKYGSNKAKSTERELRIWSLQNSLKLTCGLGYQVRENWIYFWLDAPEMGDPQLRYLLLPFSDQYYLQVRFKSVHQ